MLSPLKEACALCCRSWDKRAVSGEEQVPPGEEPVPEELIDIPVSSSDLRDKAKFLDASLRALELDILKSNKVLAKSIACLCSPTTS